MWQLPKSKTKPIYQEIVNLILSEIEKGNLSPGDRLPAERRLAELLKVNRSTVVHALDELVAMGMVIRKRGSGTIINDGKWGIYMGGPTNWRSYLSGSPFEKEDSYVTLVREKLVKQEEVINAYSGELPLSLVPDLDLPMTSWNDFLIQDRQQDSLGYIPLRQRICQQLAEEHHLIISSDELLLTSGAQQALFLLIQVLLQSGDAIAIEMPSTFYSLSIFQAAGVRLYGVPMDKEGLRVDLLEEVILKHKIKMIVVNPNFQNPTGTTLSEKRRRQLVVLARRYQLPIVEDDVFGELYFSEDKQVPLLKELDPDNVIYIGSLSKILGSTTKIGWLSAPKKVLENIVTVRQELDLSLSIFPQVLASYAIDNPDYSNHLTELRKTLKKRCEALMFYIDQELKDSVSYYTPSGGYYLWLTCQTKPLTRRDFLLLLEQDVIVTPGFILGTEGTSMRINFARLTPQESEKLVAKLKGIMLLN
ncbi:PLP-dependent aminotransferase family protein [Vagococcus intermedius]|uniref:PLP-dependent aminotransferase family protein n=1 Tax=Vagococcus intermedius TaxID=2991418 RepID=A0AAF0I6Y4_9ENTE|nr:PLP-dependent aminotransferase family protein [Vagococcus intermedius]WEG73903.1 PLP-dependent aminotransferase family protein [Vagococcus intermedius]WEG75987.1 PLP-dependent aminotransferase family protein [Vagococcus intermedius]